MDGVLDELEQGLMAEVIGDVDEGCQLLHGGELQGSTMKQVNKSGEHGLLFNNIYLRPSFM